MTQTEFYLNKTELYLKRVERKIKSAVAAVNSENPDYYHSDPPELDYAKRDAERKLVLQEHKILELQRTALRKKYKKIFNDNKDRFPRKWMDDSDTKNQEISNALERYPGFLPLVNFIFKETHKIKPKELTEMTTFCDDLTKDKRHPTNAKSEKAREKGGWPYSVFTTDKSFYERLEQKTKIKKEYAQKFLKALCDMGFLLKFGKDGNKGTVYADGYFSEHNDYPVKHPFLKEEYKNELRRLPKLMTGKKE